MPRDARFGQRREDRQLWARFLANYRDISPVIGLCLVLLAAFGFGFKTPKQWFELLEGKTTSVNLRVDTASKRIDTVKRELADLRKGRDTLSFKIDFLVRSACQRLTRQERERQAACDGRIVSGGTVVR